MQILLFMVYKKCHVHVPLGSLTWFIGIYVSSFRRQYLVFLSQATFNSLVVSIFVVTYPRTIANVEAFKLKQMRYDQGAVKWMLLL